MKAYKLRAISPTVCEVKEIKVAKFIKETTRVDGEIPYNGIELPYPMDETVVCTNGYRIPTRSGDEDVDYTEYFRTKEEAYEKALIFAQRFLEISSENLTAAQCNFRTLLDARNPSLFE